MSRTPRLLAALATALIAVAGCTDATSTDLPDAKDLLVSGAAAMANAKTASFSIDVSGQISAMTLQKAAGQLTREGSAKGTAVIEQSGTAVEIAFVIIGDSAYIKGATGDYQKLPLAFAASVYDPSAILDPERGVAKLLSSAQNATTEAEEKVGGVGAYRIAFDPDPAAVKALIPGNVTPSRSTLWLDKQTNRVIKATIPVTEGSQSATVTVSFTDYDAPATISAP